MVNHSFCKKQNCTFTIEHYYAHAKTYEYGNVVSEDQFQL